MFLVTLTSRYSFMVTKNQQHSNFGERLKAERIRLKLTQEQLAAILDKQKMAAYHYEKNNRDVIYYQI